MKVSSYVRDPRPRAGVRHDPHGETDDCPRHLRAAVAQDPGGLAEEHRDGVRGGRGLGQQTQPEVLLRGVLSG